MSHDLDGRDARNCLHCQIEKAVREAKALRAATLASYAVSYTHLTLPTKRIV